MRRLSPLFLLVACCHASPARAPEPSNTARIGIETSSGGRYPLTVELAITPQEREVGLMNRDKLGADDGMLFVFPVEKQVSFWMHNTLVPLDMIFIRTDDRIAGIVADAAPLTDTPRQVDQPSRYVLEVNGGWAAAHGVQVGDRVVLDEALAKVRALGGER